MKTSVLKGATLGTPLGAVSKMDDGFDVLTAHALVANSRLYVASKLGLWEYPTLVP